MTEFRPAVKKLMKLRPSLIGCGLEELVCAILEAYPHLTDGEVQEVILATRVPETPPRPITLKSGMTLVFPRQRSSGEAPEDEADEWDDEAPGFLGDANELAASIRRDYPTLTDEEIEAWMDVT